MKQSEIDSLADSYLRHSGETTDEALKFHGAMLLLIAEEPDIAWTVMLRMIDIADSKEQLAYIAAGPIEDLLSGYGVRFVERARLHAREDTKFLYAIANVWLDKNDAAYVHVQNIMAENNIESADDAESLLNDVGT